jgi:hypothetical protein
MFGVMIAMNGGGSNGQWQQDGNAIGMAMVAQSR